MSPASPGSHLLPPVFQRPPSFLCLITAVPGEGEPQRAGKASYFFCFPPLGTSPRSWKIFPTKQGCLTQDARLVNRLRSVQMKPSLTLEASGGLNSWDGFSSSSLCCPNLPFQFYSQRLPHMHPVLSPSLRPNRPIFMTVLMASLPWASSPDGPALGSKHQGPAPPSS